jgi:hypothetical protein
MYKIHDDEKKYDHHIIQGIKNNNKPHKQTATYQKQRQIKLCSNSNFTSLPQTWKNRYFHILEISYTSNTPSPPKKFINLT